MPDRYTYRQISEAVIASYERVHNQPIPAPYAGADRSRTVLFVQSFVGEAKGHAQRKSGDLWVEPGVRKNKSFDEEQIGGIMDELRVLAAANTKRGRELNSFIQKPEEVLTDAELSLYPRGEKPLQS